MHGMPYYADAWTDDCHTFDDSYEPDYDESEENVVCECDNCGEDIYDCDEMAVVEENTISRPSVKHICMDCWEANKWDKAEELLDMLGVWYWTGDAVDAMQIAGEHLLKERDRQKRLLGNITTMVTAAVTGKGNA